MATATPNRQRRKMKLSAAQKVALERRVRITDQEEAQFKRLAAQEFRRIEATDQLIAELRAARKQRGLSLSQVAERSGIGRNNIARLERLAVANPTVDTILRYADAVGVRLGFRVD